MTMSLKYSNYTNCDPLYLYARLSRRVAKYSVSVTAVHTLGPV